MFTPPESLLLKRSPNPPPFLEHQMLPSPSADPIEKQTGKKKRTAGKKDRHSKICTAHGIRDRRMRLSLEVSRKFFDIQDMLGYDKASATIEWLLGKSKQAIRELVAAKRQTNNGRFTEKNDELLGQEVLAKKKSWPVDNARESREKARARARWRTREKMMMLEPPLESLGWPNCVSTHQKLIGFSIDQDLLLFQDPDAGTIEKLIGNTGLSSNNNNNNNFMGGLIRDWEMLSSVTNQQGSSMAPQSRNRTSLQSPVLQVTRTESLSGERKKGKITKTTT